MKDIGWLNNWYSHPPEEYKQCREKKHSIASIDCGSTKGYGYNTIYECEICQIRWHVDSSD